MRKVTPITEQFQHFVEGLKESFGGDLNRKAQAGLTQLRGHRYASQHLPLRVGPALPGGAATEDS